MNMSMQVQAQQQAAISIEDPVFSIQDLSVFYNNRLAVNKISIEIPRNKITAFIGPSGCGKSTLLRSMNRMNDLNPEARTEGQVLFNGKNIYEEKTNPVMIRRNVGMVFQKPNPLPKSIYNNVAFGARLNHYQGDLDELVMRSLKRAALWDEVKDKLNKSGLELSGGQQQRLCIARALATEPEVLLRDEPASALDPIATMHIENLMEQLKEQYTIVIVTHNMSQASRVSDFTAFLSLEKERIEERIGILVEFNTTVGLFTNPLMEETADYVAGKFG
jgi:phosphate transport system ATP-binding protein